MRDTITAQTLTGVSPDAVIAGIDEVGRGAWAGPISVGVACITKAKLLTLIELEPQSAKINDSKILRPDARIVALAVVRQYFETAVASASARECDEFGLTEALRLATMRALDGLRSTPDIYLLDGKHNYLGLPNVLTLVKGDSRSLVIAAASVDAKVSRDRYMCELDESYPYWNFATNKGYPSPVHRRALSIVGVSSVHRVTWKFVSKMNLLL